MQGRNRKPNTNLWIYGNWMWWDDWCDKTPSNDTGFGYVYEGSVYKRFWSFLNSNGKCTETFAKCIMDHFESVLHMPKGKLIARIYGGSSFVCGSVEGVQAGTLSCSSLQN